MAKPDRRHGRSQPRRKAQASRPAGSGFVVFLLVAVLIAGSLTLVWQEAVHWLEKPGPAAAQGDHTLVTIPKGAGAGEIARQLSQAGVITHPRVFQVGARILRLDAQFKAGDYQIASRASALSIMQQLSRGEVVRYSVTLAEGLSSIQIVERLAEEKELTGEIGRIPAEGSLLPDTYDFQHGDTRQNVLDRMQMAQQKLLADLWGKRAQNLPIATAEQAVILASIVEKETGIAAERPLVASVFVNRLRQSMRLQSDPTIIYGITKGKPLGRGIRQSELQAQNPYNTYQIDGLPPTPIANPGREALQAVLNPPDTDYLFFVADGSGGHRFASNLAEHEANVRFWRDTEKRLLAEEKAEAAAQADAAAGAGANTPASATNRPPGK